MGRFKTLGFAALMIVGLVGNALASPEISGELTSTLAGQFPEPYYLVGSQELQLRIREGFGDAAAYVALHGTLLWPQADTWQLGVDEAYLDYYGPDFDLRAGRQRFFWGTALEINPTNVLNPINMQDPLGERLPVLALNLDYYPNDNFKLTGAYVPFFTPAAREIPQEELKKRLADSGLQLPPGVIPQVNVREPQPLLENGQFGLKISALALSGFDFSFSYFRGFEDMPTPELPPSPPQFEIEAQYRPVQVFGADLATAFGQAGFWAEGALSMPEEGDRYFQGICGADYGFQNDLVLVGQYLYRQDPRGEANHFLILGSNQTRGLLEWQAGLVYNLQARSFMFNPEISFSLAQSTKLTVGATYFNNEDGENPVGLLPQEQNRFYSQLQINF